MTCESCAFSVCVFWIWLCSSADVLDLGRAGAASLASSLLWWEKGSPPPCCFHTSGPEWQLAGTRESPRCPWLSSAGAPALALLLASLGGLPTISPELSAVGAASRQHGWAPPGAPLGPGHRHQGQTRTVGSGPGPSLFPACPCRQLGATAPPPTSLRGLCLPGVTAGLSQVLLPLPAFSRGCWPPRPGSGSSRGRGGAQSASQRGHNPIWPCGPLAGAAWTPGRHRK